MAAALKRKRDPAAETKSNKKRQVSEDSALSAGDGTPGPVLDFDEDMEQLNEEEDEDPGSEEDEDEEEEEWGGLGDGGMNGPSSTSASGGGKPKKPPTGEEVRAIKEATDLYKSNTFKLRIDALLPTVRPKQSRIPPLERFLLDLHTFLSSLPSIAPQLPHEASSSVAQPTPPSTEQKSKSKVKSRKSTDSKLADGAGDTAENINVAIPFPLPLPPADAAYKLAFEPPSNILLCGSWATKTGVKAKDKRPWTVDVALEMPADLFQEKDYLNGRFFHKRAYYLAVITRNIVDSASSTRKDKLNVDVFYESTNGDPRQTTLILRPRPDGSLSDFTSLNAQIRLFPCLPATNPMSTTFSRLSPTRSNIRITPSSEKSALEADVAPSHLPTPIYNSTLLLSFTPKEHLLKNHELSKEAAGFTDAIALLRVWANQRGYDGGGAIGLKAGKGKEPEGVCVLGFANKGAWWTAVVQGIVSGFDVIRTDSQKKGSGGAFGGKGRAMGRGLSSYQLFKASLDFLARWDIEKEMVFVKGGASHRFTPEEYGVHLPASPVFVDSSSYVNLLAGVPLSSLEMLRHDAKATLQALDRSTAENDSFPQVFLQDHRDLASRFDAVIRVDLSTAKLRKPSLHATLECGSQPAALLSSMSSYLRRALGQRIRALAILTPSSDSPTQLRAITSPQPSSPSVVFVGLVLDTENAFRLVDHGPALSSAESSTTTDSPEKTPAQKEVDEFRDFWGDKSELRRFKDGRIVESVVWDIKTADDKAQIPARIVQYILSRHFGIDPEPSHGQVRTWQSDFDAILKLPESVSSTYASLGMTAGSKALSTTFDELVKVLKGMDEQLVLSVMTVSPISEYLRHTSVFVPIALPPAAMTSEKIRECMSYIAPIEVVLEFEKSARWPDELHAIQKTKLAFFGAMAIGIMETIKGSVAKVVVGDGLPLAEGIVDEARLEVVLKEGWCFIFRIWHDREALLLDRIIHDTEPPALKKLRGPEDQLEKARLVREATEAREVYTRRFIHAPRHHRAVMALNHRFSAYAGTVRLVKRWLAAHWLLEGHITEEAVEILCASVFVQSNPNSPLSAKGLVNVPGTRERGFAMVVRMLAEWDWEAGPLEVAIYEETTEAGDLGSLGKGVTKGVWRLKTAFDIEGKMWTAHRPDLVAALRIRAVAKATWDLLKGMERGALDVKALFVHPVDDYDFTIQLDPAVLHRYCQNVVADPNVWGHKGRFANMTLQDDAKRPLRPGFDPARMFVDDLMRVYEHTLKIFHDPLGGDRIGALWDPKLKEPHPFKVMGNFSSLPIPKGEKAKNTNHWEVVVNESAVLHEIARMGVGLLLKD